VLLVARAPKCSRTAEEFMPCTFCLQFFVRDELYRHCRECKFRAADSPEKGFVSMAQALLEGYVSAENNCSAELKEHVFSRMRFDQLKRVAKSDMMITKLGSMLFMKLGQKRATDISARMRELARLLVHIRSADEEAVTLCDLLSGRNFDRVVADIELEAGSAVTESGRRIFKKPAFVIRVAGSLLKCAHLKQGAALRAGDTSSYKAAEDFITLHRAECTDQLLSAAHSSYRLKGNKLCEYPDEQDLKQPKTYLQREMARLCT